MTTKRELQKLVNAVNRHGGNRTSAAKELDMSRGTLRARIEEAVAAGIPAPKTVDPKINGEKQAIPLEDLRTFWSVYEKYANNALSTAEALGMAPNAAQRWIKRCKHRLGFSERALGVTHARAATKIALPKSGEIKRYMLTSLQNNTYLHEPTWAAGINLAKYYDAEIMVGTFTYIGDNEGSEKRSKEKKNDLGYKISDRWYDKRAEVYLSDEFVELAPGLVWCGHHNILPTSSDPLRGKESLNGRSSAIYPHTRVAMRSVATMPGDGTKFNVTTGTIGLRNYIQKNSGITAEFFHGFGFLLVEVNSDGEWWFRHLNSDSEGVIYDCEIYADATGVWENEQGTEALVFGDLHRATVDEVVMEETFGVNGMVDALRPKKRIFHDVFDMEARSHHNRRDPHTMYGLYKTGRDSVAGEIKQLGEFFNTFPRAKGVEDYVVWSNHDQHLERWLKEAEWRSDPPNARTILQLNLAWLDHIDEGKGDDFVALEFALHALGYAADVNFLNMNSEDPEKTSLVVCPANGGGIELALHGDIGPNGARGSGRNLSKIGRKNVIGHSHSPGIYDGTYQVGCTAKLRQGYNVGPSSWAHCHCAIYPNGKRQLLVFWNGKWRA